MGLVTLDIRQESSRHSDAIDAITKYLGIGSYKSWTEDQRVEFLIGELAGKRPLMPPGTPHCTLRYTPVTQLGRFHNFLPGPEVLEMYCKYCNHG